MKLLVRKGERENERQRLGERMQVAHFTNEKQPINIVNNVLFIRWHQGRNHNGCISFLLLSSQRLEDTMNVN
jgi:hypothetical protein